ncbi:MAG: hypothetical protein IT161_19665 [Bryobacterales bacterium]|nr:hypothetical protein [Bryobacterales bacterium]
MRPVVLMIAMAAAVWAQAEKGPASAPAPSKPIQRVVEVKYVDVRQLADVLVGGSVVVRANEAFRTISLFGPEQSVNDVEEIIKKLDTSRAPTRLASRNIELVFYILVAAPKGTSGEALPAELDPVARQLKQVFGYNDFRLVDSSVLRTREGERGEAAGSTIIAGGQGAPMSNYQLKFARTGIASSDKGNVIRIDGFQWSTRVPYSLGGPGAWSFADVGFNTNLDIREGQKIVVGKAKYEGSDNALVLVITAKAVD